jgi:hypothetical protein
MSSYGSYGVLILMMGEVSMLMMMARMNEMKMNQVIMIEVQI